ncbi:MAG: hypothetical protein ACO1QS_06430 [Verrucomicrobiota bacterium]
MATFKLKGPSGSTTAAPSESRRPKKWVIVVAVLLGLLLFSYFFLTSTYFIKSFVLPKASKTINAQITVDDISVSPFSSASLKGLKITTTGEPLISAEAAHVRYSLMDILRGTMSVSELKVQSPKVVFVQNADGTTNFDPIMKALAEKADPKAADESKDAEKPKLNLKNISLENAHISVKQTAPTGDLQTMELSNVNVTLDQVVVGTPGKLQLAADLALDQQAKGQADKNRLTAKATANFEFLLTPELAPQSIKGKGELKVGQSQGSFADLNGFIALLNAEVTPTEVKSMRVDFSQNAETLGAITVSGPFDTAKGEAKLNIVVEPLGKRVLNLAGAALGYDFGSTQLSGNTVLEASKNFTFLSVNGELTGRQFTLIKDGQQVSPLDVAAQYSVQHNQDGTNSFTKIDKLNVTAQQKNKQLLILNVTQPIQISAAGNVTGNSALALKLNQLDLADWKPLAGAAARSGIVDATVDVSFANGGKEIQTTFQTTANNLSLITGTNITSPLNAALKGKLTIQNSRSYKGNVVANATGQVGDIQLNDLQMAADLSVNISTQQVISPTLAVSLKHAGKPAGSFDLSGTFYPSNATNISKFEYTLGNLNENLLSAVLAPFLTEATLTSLTINSKGSLVLNPAGESAVKADLQVTRLLVTDKAGKLPKEPLNAVAMLDAGLNKQVLTLRTAQLNLTPTDRAKNVLTLTGKIDSTVSNAITGNLKIASEGLDVTRYYDLFTGTTSPTDKNSQPAPTTPKDPNKEPDAVLMPFKNFTTELDVKKLYLREVAAENWKATILLDGSTFKLDPAQLTLNGAPLSARIAADMSVPGFRYEMMVKADKLPIAPLANSFAPEYKDRAAGDLFADFTLKGTGTTDKSLQKNLAANGSLNFTNANIQVIEKGKLYPILSAVATALQMPEVLSSPLNAVGAEMKIAAGQIDISRASILSPALFAGINGNIPMSEVLTNSPLNLPVNFQLATSLARRIRMADQSNTNSYVPLPDFLVAKGTIGSPKADIKISATSLLKTAGNIDLGDKGNNIIKGVNSILGGKNPPTTKAPGQTNSNTTATNKPGVLDVIDLFKKKKQ